MCDPEERKEVHPDIVANVDECFPTGIDFALVVQYIFQKKIKSDKDLMSFY